MAKAITIATLTLCVGTIGANSLALGPISPGIASDFQTSVTTVMYAAAGYGLGTATGALILSPLIDRFGVRKALSLALLGLVATLLITTLSTGIAMLVIAQGVAGLAAGLGLPAVYGFATRIAEPGHESRTLGWVLTGWTLSLVIGVTLSAVVADIAHWRWVYGSLTALVLVAILALGQATPPDLREDDSNPVWPHQMLGTPGVGPLLFVCFANMAAFYGTYAYISDHINTALAMPLRATALVTLAYGIGYGLGVFGNSIIDRMGVDRTMPWFYVILAAVYAGLAIGAPWYGALIVASFLWGLFNHFGVNLIVTSLSAIDPTRVGALLGLNSAVTYLSASVGTLFFGYVYEQVNFTPVAGGSAAIVLAATALAFIRLGKKDAFRTG